MALLVLSISTTSGLLHNPQEPVTVAFAETSSINDLGGYVIFGLEEVEIKKDVVISSGNVGVNEQDSKVKLDKGTTFDDSNSSLVGDSVKIEKEVTAQNVFFNKLENKGDILGSENTPLALPVIDSFPSIPDFSPGATSIDLDKDQTLTLVPGQYDEIKVDEGATLIFEGGSYSASKIEAKKEAKLLFDDATELVIDEELKLDKESTLGPSLSSSISASEIVIFVADGDVDFDKDTVVDANIFAPNGEISMDKGAQATGAFVANKVKIDKDSTLALDSSLQIFTLIDDLEDLLAEIEELVNQVEENIISEGGVPSAETLSLLALIEEKAVLVQVIIDELEGLGVEVEPIVVEGSLFAALSLLIPGFEAREIRLPDAVCGVFMWLNVQESAGSEVPLTPFERITLLLSSVFFCTEINDFVTVTDLNLFLEASVFLLAIAVGGLDLLSPGVDLVASALNQFDLREFWLQSAISFDSSTPLASDVESIVQEYRPVFAGTIQGTVFGDSNQNMIFDSGEFGLPGWTVKATFPRLDLSEMTFPVISEGLPNNGNYLLEDLPTGIFTVSEELMPGFIQTSPPGDTYGINILAGTDFPGTDFGNFEETAELTVIKNVINDDDGTLSPSDFTIHVTGNNPSPSDFPGEGNTGGTSTVVFEQERSHAGHIRDSTDDNDCVDGNELTITTAGFQFQHVFVKIRSGGTNDCDTGLREWDVSAIPDNAEIISVEWIASFHQNNPNQYPPLCDIVQIDTRPSTASDAQAFLNEINANPAFVNDDSFCSSGGAKTINLGPAAAAHLENVSLDDDWFGFAIKARPDTTQQAFHQSVYTNELSNPTSLRVVYSVDDSSGETLVEIGPGAYSVTEDPEAGYTGSFSADCSGTISAGESKTCIITNDDDEAETAQLTVIKNVINNNAGTLSPSDFTIHVTGNNPTPSDFAGSGNTGAIFSDDFSTDNFVDEDSSMIGVSGGMLNFDMDFDNTNDASTIDLGVPLDDNGWVMRYKLNIDAFAFQKLPVTAPDSNTGVLEIGMFSADSSVPHSSSQDAISLSLQARIPSIGVSYNLKDSNDSQLNHANDAVFDHPIQIEEIYVELKRTSTTTYEASLFSDPGFSNLIEKETGIVSAGTTDLQYFGIKNRNTSGPDPDGDIQGSIDDLIITTLGTEGTLVEIGSGAYSVTEDPVAGYTGSFSPDCSGTISAGESKICTITNDDNAAPTNVVLELTRSHSGHILDNTDDNDCADGNLMGFTTTGVPFEPVFIKIRSGGVNDCNVGMREWDVSSIPDNAQIQSVEWIASFHQNTPNQYPPICDIVQLDTRPSTAGSIQGLLDEIIGNPAFLNDDSFCSSGGGKTINLGPAAASHLENVSLGNDWFAFAIKARPDTTQQPFHQSIYTNEQGNPTKLRIVYSVP